MKFINYLKTIDLRRYSVFLAMSILVYFVFTQTFQASLAYFNFDMVDAYPGLPHLPEPYEIKLYLLGYIVIPSLALFFYRFWPKLKIPGFFRILTILFFIGAVGVGFLLFSKLPSPSFLSDYFEKRSIWHAIWLLFTKRIYLIKICFAAAAFVFLIAFIKNLNTQWLNKLEAKNLKRWMPVFLILLIVLLFHPNFPSHEGFTNFIVQPASEVIHGKPLLYETTSIYGIFSVYLPALLFKLGLPISFKGFALLMMFFYLTFYVVLYKMLKIWTDSRLFALVGTWLAVLAGFFLLTDPNITAYTFPGQSAYRQGFYVFTGLFLVLYAKSKKPFLRQLTLLMSAVSLFWNIDTGVYINIATFTALTYFDLNAEKGTIKQNIKNILTLSLNLLAYIAVVFSLISGVNYLIYGSWPNWGLQIADVSTFNSGYGKYPMPKFGLYEVYILVYLLYLVWIVKKFINGHKVNPIIVFLTIFGVFSFIYYVGNSVWSYYNFVAIPVLILIWYALYQTIMNKGEINLGQRFTSGLFYGLLTFVIIMSLAKIPTVFGYRDYANISLNRVDLEDQSLYEDSQYIKNNFSDTRLAVFHDSDGKLMSMAGKINSLYLQSGDKRLYSLYDDYLVIYKRHVQGLINQIETNKPEYVFVTKSSDPRFRDFENYVAQHYYLYKTLNTLNIYKVKLSHQNKNQNDVHLPGNLG